MTASDQVTIGRRFRGPPDSGNGGYACGLLAAPINGPARVTLHQPPPLDVAIDRVAAGPDGWRFEVGGAIIGEARPSVLSLEPPAAPSWSAAKVAAQGFRGFHGHIFPGCFVCGPERDEGDGLRLFAGPLGDSNHVAATWTPDASLGDGDGFVRPEMLWAALDCQGYFAISGNDELALLGTMTAEILGPVKTGSRCIVAGRPSGCPTGGGGRKRLGATAIYSDSGKLLAKSEQIWIVLGQAVD